jgi:hypothetical protein
MPSYVVQTATMQCNFGTKESNLKVPKDHKIDINDKRQANIKDHKPFANIAPFGLCGSLANPEVAAATAAHHGKLTKRPCKPVTMNPWINGKDDVLLDKDPALLNVSTLRCKWRGTIKITDCGQ